MTHFQTGQRDLKINADRVNPAYKQGRKWSTIIVKTHSVQSEKPFLACAQGLGHSLPTARASFAQSMGNIRTQLDSLRRRPARSPAKGDETSGACPSIKLPHPARMHWKTKTVRTLPEWGTKLWTGDLHFRIIFCIFAQSKAKRHTACTSQPAPPDRRATCRRYIRPPPFMQHTPRIKYHHSLIFCLKNELSWQMNDTLMIDSWYFSARLKKIRI